MRSLMWILAIIATVGSVHLRAINVADYAVQVSARVYLSPPRITLAWPPDPDATGYTLYRKDRDATTWGSAITLATNATTYIDSNVVVGATYEYQLAKTASESGNFYSGYGYIYAGIQAPLVESRGTVLLLVDQTMTNTLRFELDRLQLDLLGDGWTVVRRDVSRTATPPQIKAVITNEYLLDPANLKSVFLFGHVPVPYSGLLKPDGHTDHFGAWPADVYYADMNGVWTDLTSSNITASRVENRNVPGDGKFDQTWLPSNLQLQVGRVDMWNLPAFPQSETELLRQYLDKDHNFRMGYFNPPRRALVDDHFGTFGGEAFAVNGYRNFAPFFGDTNIFTGHWFSTLSSNSYLWGYACGGGSYTSEDGVGTTADFVANNTQVIFTMHFGSYFGDYDAQNDLMRAQLANAGGGLTCAWAGRPHWEFHHMAMGETIGFSALMSQNYGGNGLYVVNYSGHCVHVNLLGDPTLRMHIVAPPSALIVSENGIGGKDLRWRASSDAVLGYTVYGAALPSGPFSRLHPNLITSTNYTDPAGGAMIYMVRAVKLETSASGTYTNISQGIFENYVNTFSPPSVALTQPANAARFSLGTTIVLGVNTSDANNDITQVEYYTNGVFLGRAAAWPFSLAWSNGWLGTYAITAVARDAAELSATSSVVNVSVTYGTTSIVPIHSTWKYFDLTNDLGTAWRAPDYNDTTWATGPAQLGFGDNDEQTVINTNRLRITTYFRKAFVPPPDGMYLGLTVRLLRDDGGVVYMNGNEVFRSNMPTNQPILWATQASSSALTEDESTRFYSSPVSLSLLRPGTNILAAEIHQYGLNSSDLSFDLELVATNLPAVSNTPPFISSIPNLSTDEDVPTAVVPFTVWDRECWAEGVTVTVTSSNPSLVTQSNVTFMGSGSNRFLVITPAANQTGSVQLILNASDGLATNRTSFDLTVNPVPDPPFISWIGLTNGSLLPPSPTLNLTAGDPDGNLTMVEYFVDNVEVSQATSAPFSLVWSNASMGYHHVLARATDSTGRTASTSNLFVTVLGVPLTIVNPGLLWKFWDRGSVPAANWNTLAYDDTAWPAGPSPLGYGDANGLWPATTNSYGPNSGSKYTTTYYRCSFLNTNPFSCTNLVLSIQRDDGAVIYLNGNEVLRINMPAGAVVYSTYALTNIGGADESAWYTNAIAAPLLTGTNLLAAEIHQQNASSTDIFFNLKLTAQPALQPPPLAISNRENACEFFWPDWAVGLSLWETTNLVPPVVWSATTNPVTHVDHALHMTIPMEGTPQKFYELRAW